MKLVRSSTAKARSATALCFLAMAPSGASASDFTAGVLMEKMDAQARAPYVMGVVEGLAYSRYERDNLHLEGDKKTVEGMKCIYSWFYDKPGTLDLIYAAFAKYPTYTPGVIIGNLVRQSCGE